MSEVDPGNYSSNHATVEVGRVNPGNNSPNHASAEVSEVDPGNNFSIRASVEMCEAEPGNSSSDHTSNQKKHLNRNGELAERSTAVPQCIPTEQPELPYAAVAGNPDGASLMSSPKNSTQSPAENPGASECIAGVPDLGQTERQPQVASRSSGRPRRGNRRYSVVISDRVLRSKLHEEPDALKEGNADYVSSNGEKQRKKRKRRRYRRDVDEFSRIRKRVSYLLQRMKHHQWIIDVYSSEGWKGESREKLKLERELQDTNTAINKCKMKIRKLLEHLDLLSVEGRLPETLFDSEGAINSENIFCAKCRSYHSSAENDIILCDGTCVRAFHQYCIEPPLSNEEIKSESWVCPGCNCKADCMDSINNFQGTNLSIEDSWEKVFPEADAAGMPGREVDANSKLFTEAEVAGGEVNGHFPEAGAAQGEVNGHSEIPSDESDDDYNPDGPDSDELCKANSSSDDAEPDSDSGGSDFTSASDDSSLDEYGMASLEESSPFQEGPESVSGRRPIERLDYKKLYNDAYGNLPPESSDDEDWRDGDGPRRRKARDDYTSTSLERDIPFNKDEIKPVNKMCDRKRTYWNLNIDDTKDSQSPLHEGSSVTGSCSRSGRPSKYKVLGDAAAKRLYESFKENQYPERATKEGLAKELGMTVQQVQQWFNNRRYSLRQASTTHSVSQTSQASTGHNVPQTNSALLPSNDEQPVP